MKKFSLFVLILGLVAMITACGASTPAPVATSAPAPTATDAPAPTATAAPAPTEAPTEEAVKEAPTEEVVEEAPAGGAEDEVQVIEVEMITTGYVPDAVTVKAGSHIQFNFKNIDDEEHDLYNKQVNIKTGELSSGGTLVYDWVAPETPGIYVAECTIHAGLQLAITVE